MKPLLLTLLLATLCATGYGQTIKSLGYNTTNGDVVYAGTNRLTFTNEVGFGVSGLKIEAGGTLFFFDQDGQRDFFVFDNGAGGADEARARQNLGLGATWLTNTNVTNFRTAIGLGATNNVNFNQVDVESALRVVSGTNFFFSAGDDVVEVFVPLAILSDNGINFEGSNATIAAAATRTNLSLPLPALTNTSNVTMMRALAGSTNTNQPFSGTLEFKDPNDDTVTIVVSNGIITSAVVP
jgi:hypothetical protein